MSKWISVEDRLPEVGQSCLCAKQFKPSNEWWFACCEYQEFGFPFASFQDDSKHAGITHWKKIEPPE